MWITHVLRNSPLTRSSAYGRLGKYRTYIPLEKSLDSPRSKANTAKNKETRFWEQLYLEDKEGCLGLYSSYLSGELWMKPKLINLTLWDEFETWKKLISIWDIRYLCNVLNKRFGGGELVTNCAITKHNLCRWQHRIELSKGQMPGTWMSFKGHM